MNVFLDHLFRWTLSIRGLWQIGISWLPIWLLYLVNPLLSRLGKGNVWKVSGFHFRLGECDLYTLANIVNDYDIGFIKSQLSQVQQIIDAGANVGAFIWLIRKFAPSISILAIEPEPGNFEFLIKQPFAGSCTFRQCVLSATSGRAHLAMGQNSATAHLSNCDEHTIEIEAVSLHQIVDRPCLLKMDIEGEEIPILSTPFPNFVRAISFEWHDQMHSPQISEPGTLTAVMLTQNTCWSWQRLDSGDTI